MKLCEEEISVYTGKILRSNTFLDFQYEIIQNLLQCDVLACDEKDVFDASIAWAKRACERNNQDPSKPENLRAQLKDAIYQIRFNTMTKEQIADCINSYPQLFSADELAEIICMNGQKTEYQPKQFNWTVRNLNIQRRKNRILECSRLSIGNYTISNMFPDIWRRSSYRFRQEEKIAFRCTRNCFLHGFVCGSSKQIPRQQIYVKITDMRSSDRIHEIFNKQRMLDFSVKRRFIGYDSYKAHVDLDTAILLQPNHQYTIGIQFQSQTLIEHFCSMDTTAKVNYNINFCFK